MLRGGKGLLFYTTVMLLIPIFLTLEWLPLSSVRDHEYLSPFMNRRSKLLTIVSYRLSTVTSRAGLPACGTRYIFRTADTRILQHLGNVFLKSRKIHDSPVLVFRPQIKSQYRNNHDGIYDHSIGVVALPEPHNLSRNDCSCISLSIRFLAHNILRGILQGDPHPNERD